MDDAKDMIESQNKSLNPVESQIEITDVGILGYSMFYIQMSVQHLWLKKQG